MVKPYTLLCCMALWLPLTAHAQDAFDSDRTEGMQQERQGSKVILPVQIRDKNGEEYEFNLEYFLKHGLASFDYYIASLERPDYRLTVYQAETFSDAETCPSEREKDRVILEKASTARSYSFDDMNGDGFEDIIFEAEEKDCTTGEYTKIKRIFYAVENGFEAGI